MPPDATESAEPTQTNAGRHENDATAIDDRNLTNTDPTMSLEMFWWTTIFLTISNVLMVMHIMTYKRDLEIADCHIRILEAKLRKAGVSDD